MFNRVAAAVCMLVQAAASSKLFCLLKHMFGHMHRILNIDEKKLIAQFLENRETNLLSLKNLKSYSNPHVLMTA
jgi:uncharacterized protein YbgA (DUF1722 family)